MPIPYRIPLMLAVGFLFMRLWADGSMAHAAVQGCRSDPTVILSNGAVLDLSASAATPYSDLRHVSYVLHGPVGDRVVAVLFPDGSASYSSFSFVADEAPGAYDAYTVISTSTLSVAASSQFLVVSLGLLHIVISDLPVQGLSNQTLHASLRTT